MKRSRRLLLVVGSIVLALCGILVGGAALLLATELGARWAIAPLARYGVTVERVDGRLLGPLYLGGIEYRSESMQISLDRLKLDWAPDELLRRTLHVLGVNAEGVHVILFGADRDPERAPEPRPPLEDIELPINFLLDRARVADIAITAPGGDARYRIDELVLTGKAAASELVLSRIDVHSPDLRLAARGSLTTRADYPLELDIDWSGELPETRPLAGSAAIRGTLSELRISHELTAPAPAELVARVMDVLGQPRWRVETTVPAFALAEVRDGMPAHELGLRLTASGGSDTAQAEATFSGLLEGTGAFAGDLRLTYADSGIVIDELAVRLPSTDAELTARGEVSLVGERPHVELDGEWAQVTWPLEGEATFASPTGTFHAAGDAELFRVTARATAGPIGSPPGQWQIRGEVTPVGFELRRFRGDLPDGYVEAAGSFAWARGSFEAVDGRLRFTGMHDGSGSVVADLRLRYAEPTLYLPSFVVRVPGSDARLSAAGEVILDGESPRFSLHGRWQDLVWPLQPASAGPAAANPTETRTAVRGPTDLQAGSVTSSRRPAPGSEMRANGDVAVDSSGDSAVPRYASPSGELEIVGDANRYRVTLAATIAGAAVPSGRWELRGNGTRSRFAIERLYGETLDGRVLADGEIGWDPSLSWSLVTTAEEIDPGTFVDSLPGSLAAEVTTRGIQEGDEWDAELQVVRLDGRLRGQPFDASADVRLAGDTVRLDTLVVQAGTAALEAAGRVGEQWQMAWRLDAPDLSTVHGAAAGRLSAAGTVEGAREAPMVRLELSGDSLAFLAAGSDRPRSAPSYNRVDSLRAVLAIDLSDQVPSTLTVASSGITAGGFVIEEARAVGEGDSRGHALAVTARTREDTMEVRLRGSLVNEQWLGAIERFDLSGVLAGAWHLVRPAPLRVAADSATLEPTCWVGAGARRDSVRVPVEDAQVCLDGSWTREGGGRGTVTAERLPLAVFAPLLAEDVRLDGLLSFSAEGELDAAGQLRADATLDVGPGALRYQLAGGQRVERAFDSLRARLVADADTIAAEMGLQLRDGTGLRGAVTLPRRGAPGSQRLRGQITGELHDNGLLGALVPDLAETGGMLRIDVALAGTAAHPSVTGTVALEELVADLPVQGLRLRDGHLRATADGSSTWAVSGGAASGEGRVALEGMLRLPSTGRHWGAELVLSGEDFDVYQTSLAHVTVSPDLTLRASPDRTEVIGEVRVPRSRITPTDLAGAVPASPDVVVLGDTAAGVGAVSSELGLHTNVRVVLGDSVYFDGFGLSAQLEGNVVVIDEPGRLTTGRGELRILDGEYTAYQQQLTIESGRLIFGDGPIENPGLDMRVVRQASEVLVGMNVAGTLNEPEVTLFSEPELPGGDRDVLSYLLLGRLPYGDAEEGRLLDDAAASLGLAGGDFLARRIGRSLGLDEAYVETGDSLDQAALFLGTYLSPRLYVAYGIGLFDSAVNTIRLRYTLAGGWALRAESGRETGADLLYTIER